MSQITRLNLWEAAIQAALATPPSKLRASELRAGMTVKHVKWLKPQTVTYIVDLGEQQAVYFTGGRNWLFMPGWGSDMPVFELFNSEKVD